MASRISQDDLRIGLFGDGADWLWKLVVACFPEGRQILDYVHCAEHIHKVAKLQYGEKSQKFLEWVEQSALNNKLVMLPAKTKNTMLWPTI